MSALVTKWIVVLAAVILAAPLSQSPSTAFAPIAPVAAYTYGAPVYNAPGTATASERGPPSMRHDATTYDAVGHGALARLDALTGPPSTTYTYVAPPVQVAQTSTTTGAPIGVSDGVLSSFERPGVAAKTGDGLVAPGPYAGRSIPGDATRNFTRQQRDELNEIMGETGCHRCGALSPGTKSGDAIPDHQPPLSQSDGPFELYPHCLACSREQGLFLANLIRRGGAQ